MSDHFKLNLDINHTAITRTAVEQVEASIDRDITHLVRNVLNTQFHPGRTQSSYQTTIPRGIGYEIVERAVSDYVLSEEFNQRVDAIIHEQVDGHIRNAIQLLLGSKSRKHFFEGTHSDDQ